MKHYTKQDEMDSVLIEKHVPNISLPDKVEANQEFELTVSVGDKVPHPNTIEHHIKWIQVFAEIDGRSHNPVHIATVDLGPTFAEPRAKIKMKLEKNSKIFVLGYCNLHGIWENSANVSVA